MLRDADSFRLSRNIRAQRNAREQLLKSRHRAGQSNNPNACRSLHDSIATAAASLVGFEALVFFLGRDFLTAVASDTGASALSICCVSLSPTSVSSGLAKIALGTKLGRSSPLR